MSRQFARSIDIDAPADRVWDVMVDFSRWKEWTPTVTRIDALDADMLRIGARARIIQPKLPPAVWRLTAFGTHDFTWVSKSPMVVVTARHWIEPLGPGMCRASLSIQFTGLFGGFVAWLTRAINERYLDLEARGLKGRSENPAFVSTEKI